MKLRILAVFIILISNLLAYQGYANLDDFMNWPHRHAYRSLEEFYSLYKQGLYDNTISVMTRIQYLHWALRAPFNHPVEALADINNEVEYEKYKNLMYTHLSLLLTKDYINFANRFDKEVLFWYDYKYSKELLKGFQIAKECYTNARYYWHKTQSYARLCFQMQDTYLKGPEMAAIHDEVYKIIMADQMTPLNQDNINIHNRTAYLDYRMDDIISKRLADLESKVADIQMRTGTQE